MGFIPQEWVETKNGQRQGKGGWLNVTFHGPPRKKMGEEGLCENWGKREKGLDIPEGDGKFRRLKK